MLSLAVAVSSACDGATAGDPVGTPTTSGEVEADALRDGENANRCLTTELRVHLGPGNNDMQGIHVPLRFTNTTGQPCTLHGAPGVSYVTGQGGEQIGLPAQRHVDGPVVTLEPGATASAALFLSSAPQKTPDCEEVQAGGLRVYPPNGTEPEFVGHTATACAPPLDGPFLEVGPVRPGADNTRI
ncbi:DUF4232 domain-containing protein [Lentzea xinjiangensis]|uniref:DUF4232 domain-containing protein n=1 Tax=Lentzea xinjiangensis TaxID=402600 RepID=UPI0015A6ACC8|nr:DUF4232 domain-containing protein [Lentzea xinjiangensis]